MHCYSSNIVGVLVQSTVTLKIISVVINSLFFPPFSKNKAFLFAGDLWEVSVGF